MNKHPNAIASGSTGGAGAAVIYVLGLLGVSIPPVAAALIVTGASALVLAIGREGIRGIVAHVWRGSGS